MATRKNATNAGPAAKRKKAGNKYQMPESIPLGTILTDNQKGQWKIGPSIGIGGFGEIYAAYNIAESVPKHFDSYPYVVKIEPHENGPLFVEKTFYMKNCQSKDIEKHRKRYKLKHLGIPHYVSSGTHDLNNIKHRFLVIPRYGESLQTMLLRHDKCLPLQAVYRIALQMLDVLEFIHLCGYVHTDLKATNILFVDKAYDRVCLVDYGLATKCDALDIFKPDPKKKHNGTIEYTSRDAHQGVSTMRGDLEVLAYNLVEWAGGKLPWNEEKILKDCNKVQHMKEASMGDETPTDFVKRCFAKSQIPPKPLADFIQLVVNMRHNAAPNYTSCSQLFDKALKQLGVSRVGNMGLTVPNLPPDSPSTSGPLVLKKNNDKRKNITATPKKDTLPDTEPNTPETSPSTSTRITRSSITSTVASNGPIAGGTSSKSLSRVSVQVGTPKKSRRGVPPHTEYSPRVVVVKINIDSYLNLNAPRSSRQTTRQSSESDKRDVMSDEDITLHVTESSDEGDVSQSIFD
ncbi:nucleosomal histone kinase 1-like [Anopheles aquasalis]|uniref:nucleosomal histone kinase 1-like n=1 Tax=Anopheles aquasalis TaxID=42839 RepID=UPI00215A361D|nr:nucleosomal histone kinase 1-like [Anopheles aquasalis]